MLNLVIEKKLGSELPFSKLANFFVCSFPKVLNVIFQQCLEIKLRETVNHEAKPLKNVAIMKENPKSLEKRNSFPLKVLENS